MTTMFNKIFSILLGTSLALTGYHGFPQPAEALIFSFELDNSLDGDVTEPIVGTGLFSFDGDPGNGTFSLTSLPNFDFLFDFDGDIFTNDNIVSNPANVNVIISGTPPARSVNFSGLGGGPENGSLGFINNDNLTERILSFDSSGTNTYLTRTELTGSPTYAGNYRGSELACPCNDIPEPSLVVSLFLFGVVGWLGRARKVL